MKPAWPSDTCPVLYGAKKLYAAITLMPAKIKIDCVYPSIRPSNMVYLCSAVRVPNRPVGRNSRIRIRIRNENKSRSVVPI